MFLKKFLTTAGFAITLAIAALNSACQAQPDRAEIEELSRTVRQLQDRLSQMNELGDSKSSQRVTSIGTRQSDPYGRAQAQSEVQFYDLSDIFGIAPQYPVQLIDEMDLSAVFPHDLSNRGGGGMGGGGMGGGGGVFSIPSTPEPMPSRVPVQDSTEMSSLSMSSIVDVIENTIDQGIWSRSEASISIIGKSLLISAPTETQAKIARLFDLFRTQWGSLRTVSIQAHWIRLTPMELNGVVNNDASRKLQREKGVAAIDDVVWEKFFATASEEKRIAYSSVITAHNAQTSSAISGVNKSFVTGVSSEFSDVADHAPARIGNSYQLKQLRTGLSFQLTPIATRGGNFVVLDLHCRIVGDQTSTEEIEVNNRQENHTASGGSGAAENDSQPNQEVPADELIGQRDVLDHPMYNVQRLSTTIRCPVDHFVLAGGMTMPDSAGRDNADQNVEDRQSDQLYLFVMSRVFNVVPDESDRKPATTDPKSTHDQTGPEK